MQVATTSLPSIGNAPYCSAYIVGSDGDNPRATFLWHGIGGPEPSAIELRVCRPHAPDEWHQLAPPLLIDEDYPLWPWGGYVGLSRIDAPEVPEANVSTRIPCDYPFPHPDWEIWVPDATVIGILRNADGVSCLTLGAHAEAAARVLGCTPYSELFPW